MILFTFGRLVYNSRTFEGERFVFLLKNWLENEIVHFWRGGEGGSAMTGHLGVKTPLGGEKVCTYSDIVHFCDGCLENWRQNEIVHRWTPGLQ